MRHQFPFSISLKLLRFEDQLYKDLRPTPIYKVHCSVSLHRERYYKHVALESGKTFTNFEARRSKINRAAMGSRHLAS
jgi:hypothetical protein